MHRELPASLHRPLAERLGERWLTDPADCLTYAYDNSRRQAKPQAVALAESHDEVRAIAAACHEQRVALTVRGRGTNTTGATVPLAGGVVLSLERMNRVLEVAPADRYLVCEGGTLNGDVQAAAGEHGLFWPPDPTSAGYSSVGGNIGCNAGGPRAVKYGTVRDNILGLRAVLADGREIRTGCRTSKGVVGYDLTRLLVGSEGTLAIVTEATLKLLPRPPQQVTLRACYTGVAEAAAAVARIMNQPQLPSALEFMDGDAVMLAQRHRDTGVPDGTGALLLLAADGDARTLPIAIDAIRDAAAGDGLVEWRAAEDDAAAAELWACRKALSPALRSIAPKKINEDVAVPVSRVPELIDGLRELARRHEVRIVNFGHAGNGNIHVNLLGDPDDAREAAAMQACLGGVFRLVLSLGGTISGEHGVGIDKRDFVSWEVDADTLALMRAIKHTLDPHGILNPGKSLPDPDTEPARETDT